MSHLRSRAVLASCLLLVLGNAPVRAAQDKPNKGASEEKALFLVARPALQDPIFKESVVLMLPPSVATQGLMVGLIVNRPARVALSEIFPDDDALKNRSETAYFGGPVDPLTPGVVFRSNKAAKQAALLFGDIYVSFDPDFIKELLKKPEKTPDLRLFLGRSQWLPVQLRIEMEIRRAWYSMRAETSLIFSGDPQDLWRRLFERAEPPDVAGVSGGLFDHRPTQIYAYEAGKQGSHRQTLWRPTGNLAFRVCSIPLSCFRAWSLFYGT